MLGRVREIGGFRNGEYLTTTTTTAYVGGQPACMTTGGTVDVPTSDPLTGVTTFLGVFANAKGLDQKSTNLLEYGLSGSGSGQTFSTNGYYKATIVIGPMLVRLQSGTKDGVADGYPYLTGDTWVANDKLYISTGGYWTNTRPGAATLATGAAGTITLGKARGVVLAVGTDYLDVLINN